MIGKGVSMLDRITWALWLILAGMLLGVITQ